MQAIRSEKSYFSFPEHRNRDNSVGQAERLLDRGLQSLPLLRANDEPVHDHIDRMVSSLVQARWIFQKSFLAIDSAAQIPFLVESLEKLLELTLAFPHNGRIHNHSAPAGESADLFEDLFNRLFADLSPALRAMGNADTREKQPEIVVYLR